MISSRIRRLLMFAGIVFLVSGCSATGRDYRSVMQSTPSSLSDARIFVYREAGGVSNRVFINNQRKTDLKGAGFLLFQVPPSEIQLMVDAGMGTVGECVLAKQVAANKSYYFEVNQRPSFALSSLFGYVGQALESAGKTCGGTWEIKEVAEIDALKKMESLKHSVD